MSGDKGSSDGASRDSSLSSSARHRDDENGGADDGSGISTIDEDHDAAPLDSADKGAPDDARGSTERATATPSSPVSLTARLHALASASSPASSASDGESSDGESSDAESSDTESGDDPLSLSARDALEYVGYDSGSED